MHERFLREAIRLAEESVANGGGPFGAVVVRGEDILGRGNNRVTLNNDPTAHAEVQAIRQACATVQNFSLQGCALYVNCEPCPMCLAAAYWARLDAVYYAANASDAASAGFDDVFIWREMGMPLSERSIPMHQALHEEALSAFKQWRELENKIEY